MSVFKDLLGNDFSYWPLSLLEGETSEVVHFALEGPVDGELYANTDPRVYVWCKKADDVGYTNISTGTIDLSSIPAGYTEFMVYVQALSPISGLERVPLSVTAGSGTGAGWNS